DISAHGEEQQRERSEDAPTGKAQSPRGRRPGRPREGLEVEDVPAEGVRSVGAARGQPGSSRLQGRTAVTPLGDDLRRADEPRKSGNRAERRAWSPSPTDI